MLVKPPGSLGSTCLDVAAKAHSDVLVLSDLTLPSFKIMRDDFICQRYSTLTLLEVDKIYSRQQATAMNLEGLIKGLTEEGFRNFATEDARMPSMTCRAHVQGAMTTVLQRKHWERWVDNGFSRRFLWIVFRLADPRKIAEAVHQWKKIELGAISSKRPVNGKIPYDLDEKESKQIELAVKEQVGGQATAYVIMKKIACVWKWKYRDDKIVQGLLKDLSPALSRNGTTLEL